MKTKTSEEAAEWTGFSSEEEKKEYWKYHSFEAMIEHRYDVYDEINADQISAGFPPHFDLK